MSVTRLSLIPLLVLLAAGQAAGKGEVETVEGCEVRMLRVKYVKENSVVVSWSGACNKNGIAEGSGVLFYQAKDGSWGRFSGTLAKGWAEGEGDYRMTDGARKVGRFSGNLIAQGRYFEPSGRFAFEGTFEDGNFSNGTYRFEDGTAARGSFDPAARYIGSSGVGILHAEVLDAAGAVKHWLVGTTRYATLADYERATTAYLGQLAAQRQAAYNAEQERLAAERQRQAAEADRTYQAVAGALLGAAQAYNQQQIAALGGYQAPAPVYTPPAPAYKAPAYTPPAPVYTPPAPVYTPPAPVYQAPAPTYQAPAPQPQYTPPATNNTMYQHRPELVANHCVKLEFDQLNHGHLANRCNVTIEVSWCVVGRDCKPAYSNQRTFGAGSTWPIGQGPLNVNFAACVGANKYYATSEMARAMQYRCIQ